jgi:hypothetical protein
MGIEMTIKSKLAAGLGIAALALAVALPTQSQAQDGELAIGRSVEGELTADDSVDGDKQYYDEWTLRAAPGAPVSVLLSSEDFDTELRIVMSDGTMLANDDNHIAAETTDSRLDIVMPAEGTVSVRARSFRPAATGVYAITVAATDTLAIEEDGPEAAAIRIGDTREAALTGEDYQNHRGRHVDYYAFEGEAGQRLDLHLNSRGFDTVLALEGPDGFVVRNDDDATAGEATLNSRVVVTLPASGAYRILVTSYGTGETGDYTLATGLNRDGAADTEAAGGDAQPLQFDQTITDTLGKEDDTLSSGEYLQRYSFEGRRGQPVTIDLSSEDFDTYLILRTPSGEQIDIDDTGESLNSRFERVLDEDGLYSLIATTYAPGATGEFRLALSEGTTRIPADPETRQVFAISVGIADYGGNTSNLTNTDTDAQKLYRKLEELGVLREESILLTNQDASIDAFRQAFRRVAAQAGPNDIFLFFFSGHGNQIDDEDDTGELDRRDETLVFADGEELTDDELAAMFREVHAGTAMLVLDSCFSGGFERDVITRPGMMGLFSSEEDLTSLVASEFNAGGYLARFFADAIGGQADDNGDHNVTAGELVSYIRYRFREQCNGRNCIEAETGDAQRNHQELVVQRGSVQVDDILVVLPEQYGVMRGGD